jgi:hypothetical protein
MIVDNKQFTAGEPARAGTLWICSQIPGTVLSQDVTDVLTTRGFWPSYNVPWFQSLWYSLGYGLLVEQYGDMGAYLWDYNDSFRALIFARDAPNVESFEDMMSLMQENNWQTDPLSKDCAELAISARMDLSAGPLSEAAPSGGIDCKITAASMLAAGPMGVWAKSGPTVENQPPFVWSTSQWAATPHQGLPDQFDFDWQTYTVEPLPADKDVTKIADKAIMSE